MELSHALLSMRLTAVLVPNYWREYEIQCPERSFVWADVTFA